MEYARIANVKKVIFSSTREVYGKMDDGCLEVDESSLGIIDQLGVRACYPESKKMGECIINSYNLQYGVNYTILRIAHSYGPGMPISNDGRIMSDLISNAVNRENITLKSDGSAIRGFCYISDLVSGIMYATFVGDDNKVYNICNEDENISVLDLANKIVSLYPDRNLTVSRKNISEQEREAYCKFKRVKMNTNRLRKLGWKPVVRLDDGLRKTIDSFEGGM
jgi:nucleoside-diphosphate-sugar epimerase